MDTCDFCQRPTSNDRDADGELLCHQCRQADAKQRSNGQLNAATSAALAKLPAELNDRILKAADLVSSGYVRQNGAGWIVRSQFEAGQSYHVNNYGCTCPDAAYQAPAVAGRRACKHQIAVWLVKKQEQQDPEPAAPAWWREFGRQLKTRVEFCDRCGEETEHGFGVGCLACVEQHRRAA